MARIKTIKSEKIWESFVQSSKESNFLQSYYYGLASEKMGKKVLYLGIFEKEGLKGICLGVLERAKRGRYLSIAGGPLLDWNNKKIVHFFLEKIKQIAKKEGCIFVRMRPQILDQEKNRKLFRSLGLIPAPIHLTAEHTLQLDLKKTAEDLLKEMRKSTRYEIRRAQKLKIKVISSGYNPKLIKSFYKAHIETSKRNNFIPFPMTYIKEELKAFAQKKMAKIYLSRYKGKNLAYAIIIHYPTESSYHFGASTLMNRKLPGSYAVLWKAILDAKKMGIPRFNLWGIVDKDKKNHRYFYVSLFKRGFGGQEIKYIPAHDLIVRPFRYLLVYIFESIRKRIRRL